MATGRIQVAQGQYIQSNAWGNVLWDQSINTFASAADRANQWPAPLPGSLSWLDDLAELQYHNGTRWQRVAGRLPGNPPAPFWCVAGSSFTGSTNAAGGINITVPAGVFGTGQTYPVCASGDNAAGQFTVQPFGASTATVLGLQCYLLNGSTLNNATVRINWLAMGFAP